MFVGSGRQSGHQEELQNYSLQPFFTLIVNNRVDDAI